MGYNTNSESWFDCDAQILTPPLDTTESATVAVQSGGFDLPRGILVGLTVKGEADAGNTAVRFRLYSDAAKTQLLLLAEFDMSTANVGTTAQDAATLAAPIPFFASPFYSVQQSGGVATAYTTTFMVKALA